MEICIYPGKFKVPTENSFINFKEFLNEKVSNEHIKAYSNFGISKKKRKVYLQKN